MFCVKCGNEIPDNSVACPVCGAPIASAPQEVPVTPAAPVAPVQQAPVGQPVAPATKNLTITYDIKGFMGDFFKSPIDACTSRAESMHWLLGLTFAGGFAILSFIFTLINFKDYEPAKFGFCDLFTQLCAIAGFVLFTLLFSKAFKLTKKLDFLSSLSLVGLAFMPYCAGRLVAFLNTKLYEGIDISFFSISSIFTSCAVLFIAVTLYDFAMENRSDKTTKVPALLFVICSMAGYYLSDLFFNWMWTKMFF